MVRVFTCPSVISLKAFSTESMRYPPFIIFLELGSDEPEHLRRYSLDRLKPFENLFHFSG